MKSPSIEEGRAFLKDRIRLTVDFTQVDQHKGVPPPPVAKPAPPDGARIDLVPKAELGSVGTLDVTTAIDRRKSHRRFQAQPLTLEELSYLLWATQGLRGKTTAGTAFRTVPSAGCRHALETYLCALNVSGLDPAVYRYLPLEHQLLQIRSGARLDQELAAAALDQTFLGRAPVTFIWTAVPYRMEWRYGAAAHKVIAVDAGHVCQNLYLAGAVVGCGTCAVAAYNQDLMDRFVDVDGGDEFVVYLAPVGKIS